MRFSDRIVVGLSSNRHGVSAEMLNLQISWQAQYLVMLDSNQCCSAHCK